jgi:hypothetical protein
MAIRNGAPCRAVAATWERLNDIPGSQDEKLWKRNAGLHGNDLQWSRLLRHYAIERADFDGRPRARDAMAGPPETVRATPLA